MESPTKQESIFRIELPKVGDEIALAPMHIQAWKQSYVTPESGLTNEMVDEYIEHILKGTDFRKNTIIESLANPEKVLYRVVRNENDDIVGFFHGSKTDECNKLNGVYLLDEAKDKGIGGKLMKEFLVWSDKNKHSHVEAFTFNKKALGFYDKYGFIKTDKPIRMYKDKLPFIEMVRPAEIVSS